MDFITALGTIIILDLVLAGDNAVVIALASRNLPQNMRQKAIYVGTAGAIGIRIVMTVLAAYLLTISYIQAIGGLLLLPIAIKLLKPSEGTGEISVAANFSSAVKTIIVADAAMGIDNVLAIAGAAHGNLTLVVVGLLISVPIIIWGSSLIAKCMDKFPMLITLGAAILAYTSATMIIGDKVIGSLLLDLNEYIRYILPVIFVVGVVSSPYFFRKKA
ncbi:TerC family protein [Pectinatus cerevisiiphilus]|uniref:YjbE family integral membrane protein n=1 Tax=Pectinatus cerevisiiphilus TaxID=86956 RepID=A0A4R3K6I2_9FIRM|nr:TerC family protein [Pectinatus cerevisiiphilus]TCS78397.1 YjbE family integral membrane protein [Pectinatus cerevisiiphilus]